MKIGFIGLGIMGKPMAKNLLKNIPEDNVRLIVNKAADLGEAIETHRKLNMAVRSFLGGELAFTGWIVEDDALIKSVHAHKPLLLYAPDASASRLIRQIAKNLHREASDDISTESSVVDTAPSGIAGFFAKLRNLFRPGEGG